MAGLIGTSISAGANVKMAREERKFRREMATTAYQYTMADMRKAGLNPMLAFSQGPSAVPSAGSLPKVDIDTGGVASTAMQVKKFGSELAAINQGTETASALQEKHQADADLANAGVPRAKLENELWMAGIKKGRDILGLGKKKPTTAAEIKKAREEFPEALKTRPRRRPYPPRGIVRTPYKSAPGTRGATGSY